MRRSAVVKHGARRRAGYCALTTKAAQEWNTHDVVDSGPVHPTRYYIDQMNLHLHANRVAIVINDLQLIPIFYVR